MGSCLNDYYFYVCVCVCVLLFLLLCINIWFFVIYIYIYIFGYIWVYSGIFGLYIYSRAPRSVARGARDVFDVAGDGR